jgi:nucleoside-diphosphate-sugar epimerase
MQGVDQASVGKVGPAIGVLGGSGFIGTRLCQRLINAGHRLSIYDKQPSQAFPNHHHLGDVRDLPDLTEWMAEESVVINLAAEHRDDVRPRSLYDEVNVQGAEQVCEAARQRKVKTILFTSTVAVYGFAPVGTDESGEIAPFNDYGRTKYEAEQVYRAWQAEDPQQRCLVIIRPTVVFGEQNRGNVYNLLKQIASGRFIMVGHGNNRKSMAYVENVAAFIEHSLGFGPGVHVYNFIDKPDFSMNRLVSTVNRMLGRKYRVGLRLPYWLGYGLGKCFDGVAALTRRSFTISSIRVKKFCSDTVFDTSVGDTGFKSPVSLEEALERTIRHEFLEDHSGERVFYSE